MKGRKLVFAGEDMCTLPGKQHILRHWTFRNQFVQKSSSSRLTCTLSLQHYCMPLLPGHKCSAHLTTESVCKIYTVIEVDTDLLKKKFDS